MIKVTITNMDGELLESMIVTAEQSHLNRTDWSGDVNGLARNVAETITRQWNIEE